MGKKFLYIFLFLQTTTFFGMIHKKYNTFDTQKTKLTPFFIIKKLRKIKSSINALNLKNKSHTKSKFIEMNFINKTKKTKKFKNPPNYTFSNNKKFKILELEDENFTIKLINLKTNNTKNFKHVDDYKFCKNNSLLAIKYNNNLLKIINLKNKRIIKKFKNVCDYEISNNGTFIAIQSFNNISQLFNLKNNKMQELENMFHFTFSNNNKFLVAKYQDDIYMQNYSVKLINLDNNKIIKNYKNTYNYELSNNSMFLILNYKSNRVELINLKENKMYNFKNIHLCRFNKKGTFFIIEDSDYSRTYGCTTTFINLKNNNTRTLKDIISYKFNASDTLLSIKFGYFLTKTINLIK